MVGELADQPPFGIRELGARGTPPRRLAVLADRSELQGEQMPQGFLDAGPARDEIARTLGEHGAEIDRGGRKAELAIAAGNHLCPHIVEEIGKKRQGAGS